jgi:hypothetical protein
MPGNLELHRPAVAAFNTRDVERFIAFCDPQIELRSAVIATVYRGHEGVREWHRDISEAFGDEVRLEPEAFSISASTRSPSTSCTAADSAAAPTWRSDSPTFTGGGRGKSSTSRRTPTNEMHSGIWASPTTP